jgi:hypothetical protein
MKVSYWFGSVGAPYKDSADSIRYGMGREMSHVVNQSNASLLN